MAKGGKNVFFCGECGYESAKWLGQCPACGMWNSFVEGLATSGMPAAHGTNIYGINMKGGGLLSQKPVSLSEIESDGEERILTGIEEFDRVLGGGIVPGSLILVGGDPGIGKSTLLIQLCRNLADGGIKVLYVSGEESVRQIKLRADRIGEFNDNLKILCEINLDNIAAVTGEMNPGMIIIDSIQTMVKPDISSAPGSVAQVKESTNMLLQIGKGRSIPIFIVGHVTKEGIVAGPRVLEHMVDTVLYFEGDRYAAYRILRAVKNRFGSANEIGVFEMGRSGLAEVKNPSEYMLSGRPQNAPGSVVACSIEGTRPMLTEIQALICKSNLGMPRRTAAGTDYNRVNLLLAVLEKRVGLKLSECDAYINITGGIKVAEPALDLGIILAVMSSYRDMAVDDKTIVFGEVGLAGEVRSVSMPLQRIREAVKLGFNKCIMPKLPQKTSADIYNEIEKTSSGIELVEIENVREALKLL